MLGEEVIRGRRVMWCEPSHTEYPLALPFG
jgi:hypothetical protein